MQEESVAPSELAGSFLHDWGIVGEGEGADDKKRVIKCTGSIGASCTIPDFKLVVCSSGLSMMHGFMDMRR